MKIINTLLLAFLFLFLSCSPATQESKEKEPVDYVNPYMGNISHLLVPTYPTVHLPNSMLRVYPERADFTGDMLNGLPLIVTSHRGRSAFNLSPYQGTQEGISHIIPYSYDNEKPTPYSYDVFLDDQLIQVNYALSNQSALYHIEYTQPELPVYLILNSHNRAMQAEGNTISGYQLLENNTKVYLYLESEQIPENIGVWNRNGITENTTKAEGNNACVILGYGTGSKKLKLRYGISFISEEQAKANLRRELNDYNIQALAAKGRATWNDELGKINIGEGNENAKTVFYTSLYRCFERPVCISEDGRYYSAFDGQIHNDVGIPFYTDDWIWDTYRATHPLRVLIDDKTEVDIINSYLRMAEQMGDMWMPTFPEITGDSRRMNSNHAVATVIDGYAKGLRGFDLAKAYLACKQGIENKTLIPWSGAPAGWLDDFYKEKGYIPALYPGEKEIVANVNDFEKRQPVAVTLGTAYDQWCLSRIAAALGLSEEAEFYRQKGYNYRNLYNPETGFFHPKDKDGKFIYPFDYRYDGGMGAREYYGENNGWVHRWDVPHNVADLICLMGRREQFIRNLNQTFNEPLGKGKHEFYAQLPDHTGNVGQFSMANEPSLHIPYLYNYAGQPWKT